MKLQYFEKSYTASMNTKKAGVIVDAIEGGEWFHLSELIQHTEICQKKKMQKNDLKQNQQLLSIENHKGCRKMKRLTAFCLLLLVNVYIE